MAVFITVILILACIYAIYRIVKLPEKSGFNGDPYATYMLQQTLIAHKQETGEDLLHVLFNNKTNKTKTMQTATKTNAYKEMPPFERSQFICKLLHAIQSSTICYEGAQEVIDLAVELGLFNGVKIGIELTAVENSEI